MKMKRGFWLGTADSYIDLLHAEARIAPSSIGDMRKMHIDMLAEEGQETGVEYRHLVEVKEGVGIIHISGTLTNDYDWINQYVGLVSYAEIAAAATALANDSSIDSIALSVDSPGGSANGIEQAADVLAAIDSKIKPVYSYTNGTMASAAYWLGSIGREVWASPMANVGSIGVVAVHMSYEKQLERQGIDVTVMREGKYKFIGNPYENLTEDVRSKLQGQMNIIYGMFVSHVADRRGMSVESLTKEGGPGQGQVYLGLQAVGVGLVDNIGTFDKFLSSITKVNSSVAKFSSGGYSSNPSMKEVIPMKNIVIGGVTYALNEKGIAAVSAGLSEDDAFANPDFRMEVVEDEASQAGEDQQDSEESSAGDDSTEVSATSEEEEGEETEEGKEPQPKVAASSDSGLIMEMVSKVEKLTSAKATLESDLKKATRDLDITREANSQMKRIVMASINRMEIAMNMASSKSADFDTDDAIVAKFLKLESEFNAKFKPGAKAEHSTDAGRGEVSTASNQDTTLKSQAAKEATSFGARRR